jgi:NADH-quinone oxidoreductase subunit N
MAIFMLSLAGLPPLAGFFGKFYLFSAALGGEANRGLLWLVVVALFGSLVSLYYYLIVLKVIFVDDVPATTAQPLTLSNSSDPLSRITISVLALSVFFLGLTPGPLVGRIVGALSKSF